MESNNHGSFIDSCTIFFQKILFFGSDQDSRNRVFELFDMKVFRKMKKTAFVVNTSRGKIVNEKDLATALKKKIIAGAALDVYENEPIGKKHPLTKIQNVVLAPHIGSSTKETRAKMAEITIRNLNLGINGKKPIYSVGY